MLRIINVVGARPNFMKIAPLMDEMLARRDRIQPVLIHTGQHYDEAMNDSFFRELAIPQPDLNLEVGSATHAQQTAQIMIEFERALLQYAADWVVVVGDVNSTMAATLVASKLRVKVAHVEAGLRSFDRSMPEEVNRLVTDALADLLLTPSRDADQNLLHEGIPADKIRFVGNIMIDTLHRSLDRARNSTILRRLNLGDRCYCAMTLHRPSNVDDRETLAGILKAVATVQSRLPIVFPMHPRTRARVREFGLDLMISQMSGLKVIEPLGYLDFLQLYSNSSLVMTDSGGLQEETTVLGIPCLTLRDNTERPVTITHGTNLLVGSRPEVIEREALAALEAPAVQRTPPEFWDGRAAARIVDALEEASR